MVNVNLVNIMDLGVLEDLKQKEGYFFLYSGDKLPDDHTPDEIMCIRRSQGALELIASKETLGRLGLGISEQDHNGNGDLDEKIVSKDTFVKRYEEIKEGKSYNLKIGSGEVRKVTCTRYTPEDMSLAYWLNPQSGIISCFNVIKGDLNFSSGIIGVSEDARRELKIISSKPQGVKGKRAIEKANATYQSLKDIMEKSGNGFI